MQNKALSLAIVFVLFFQLFTPIAFAASPMPSASAASTTKTTAPQTFTAPTTQACPAVMEISAADRERLWANTMGFLPSEINDLSEGAALANTATDKVGSFTNPVTNPYSTAATGADGVKVITLAQILGVDAVQVVKDLCNNNKQCLDVYLDKDGKVLADSRIPIELANDYVEAYSKKKGLQASQTSAILDQLRQYNILPGQTNALKIPTPTPPIYSDLKIAVSGGTAGKNEYALSDLFKAKSVDPESCILNENIAGRVTYEARITRNVAFCNEGDKMCKTGEFVNPASGKQEYDIPENQYFTSKDTAVWLNLNGGSHFVVPSFFEDWLSFAKKWNQIDFVVSLVAGTMFLTQKPGSGLKNAQAEQSELRQSASKNMRFIDDDEVLARLQAQVQANPRSAEFTAVMDRYTQMSGSQDQSQRNAARQILESVQAGRLDKNVANIPGVVYNAQGIAEFDPAERSLLGSTLKNSDKLAAEGMEFYKAKTIGMEVEELAARKEAYNAMLTAATRRVTTSMVIAGAWLGPARLAFASANAMLFNFGGRNSPQHVVLFAGGANVGKFQEATDVFGSGRVMEVITQFTGGSFFPPQKSFKPGSLFFINKPADDSADSNEQAWTHIFAANGSWTINTRWPASSFVTAFEDVGGFSDKDKFTSLQMLSYNNFASASLDRRDAANTLSYLALLSLPWLVSYPVMAQANARVLGLGIALLTNQIVLRVDPNEFKDVECSKQTLDKFKTKYLAVLGGSYVLNYLTPMLGLMRNQYATALQGLLGRGLLTHHVSTTTMMNTVNALNLPLAFQWYIMSRAQNYVTACKDPQHLIFAYQELKPATKKTASTANDKLSSLTDAIANLKLGQAAAQAATQNGTPLSSMKEILNVKLGMENQYGNIQPEDIFYLQIERSAFSVKSRLWEMMSGENCRFVENYQSGDKTARFDVNGINFYDKQGRLLAQFNDYAWRLRSLGRLRSQELARVILPNKIIQAQLACGDTPFIEVKAGGSPAFVGSCTTTDCLKQRIFEVTGRSVDATGDLTPFLGRVSSVDTSDGIAAIEQNAIRFTRLVAASGKNGAKKGSEISAPSIDDYASLGTRLEGSKITVLGNGQVQLDGPPGSTVTNESLGEIRTIIGDRGKLEYDPSTGNIVLFIYVLADELAANIDKIGVTPTKNALSDGTEANAIKMDTGEKTGLSDDFRNALKSIQGDGGMQSWEDENHLFYLTKDAAGNDVLRVVDKKTGEVTDYKVTGPITKNADGSITIPTDQGNFKFWFDKDPATGAPILHAEGPGLQDLAAALLAARGQNGIMTFNPSTGAISIYNGQDIPLSPEFAKKGISFTGDAQGNTIGTPQENLFGPTRGGTAGSTTSSDRQPFSLPSWPEDAAVAAIMLASVLGLVLVIRRKTFTT